MKKITIVAVALGCATLIMQTEARVKPDVGAPQRAGITSYNIALSQENLVEDLGPVSSEKALNDVAIPKPGRKNAQYVQFSSPNGETNQVLISTQKLTQKKAGQNGLDWQAGKGQTVVEVFTGQNDATAERGKMHLAAQKAILNSEAQNGSLSINVNKNGLVKVGMQNNGKSTPLCKFNCHKVVAQSKAK
ncbi:MAG: hypothetical protein WD055_00360 [Candidatus Dependentiae bacterium]